MEKIAAKIKRLSAKKESLFSRLQTLYNMITNLSDEKVQSQFLIGFRAIDRSAYEKIIDDINDLELEYDPDFSPNYEPLNAYDTIHGAVTIAWDKIHAVKTENQPETSSKYYPPTSNPSHELPYHNFKFSNSLPPLEINKFSGNVTDWPRYRDLFTSIIINNPRLTNVEKLHYLVTTLSDQPAEIVKDFSLTDSNFDLAWEALKDRFESDRVLASSYFQELTKFVTVPSRPTIESLQSFITRTTSNVSGLQKMKINSLSDFLFFSIAIRQLDPLTRKEFESKHSTESIPSFESLIKFVKSQCRLLEITASGTLSINIENISTRKNNNSKVSSSHRKLVLSTQVEQPSKGTLTPFKNSFNKNKCALCTNLHHLYHCPKFLALSVPDRRSLVKQNNLCYNCMGNHAVKSCKSEHSCHCSGRHHRLLHWNPAPPPQTRTQVYRSVEPPSISSPAVTQPIDQGKVSEVVSSPPILTTRPAHPSMNRTSVVFLGTACALIKNSKGRFERFRLLIDCGSTATFITKSLVEKLGLSTETCSQQFSGLSNNYVGSSSGVVECSIRPLDSNRPQIPARALVVDNILQSVPQLDIPSSIKRFVSGLQLADPEFYKSQPVHMLLGCDVIPHILCSLAVPPHHVDLGVLPTVFGHVIIGSLPLDFIRVPQSHVSLVTVQHTSEPPSNIDADLHKSVERFWELESITRPQATDPAEEFCEQHFLSTYRRTSEGRYIVEMPFSCDYSNLKFPKSKELALQRFFSLESKFRKNITLKNECNKFMKEYLALGHMIRATRPGKYFIPYFCVHNINSITTPTRVVFDGSCKRSSQSLNDMLLPGPKLQNEVPDVLLNFRLSKFVFCCDVSKMYRQIQVKDEHCAFMHILYRESADQPLEEYELRTVTYGLSPSSFLAHRVLKQLAIDEGSKYPLASRVLTDSSVVDDYLVGADSLEDLLEIKRQLSGLLSSGCFPLNKWLSNSPEFIAQLKQSDTSGSLVIRNTDDNTIKVLGVGWDPDSDEFFLSLEPPAIQSTYTKRNVLSTIARIYDPLGFTAPMIFLCKCILKEVWLSGVGWDEAISPTLTYAWHQCLAELPTLSQLRIPRCIFPARPLTCTLLGFCDGSLKGSAAVVYLRVEFPDQRTRIFFLKAKTKVAPNKVQTVPRLELIGAVLLSQLICSIKSFLDKLPVSHYNTMLFSDSTIVLSWIRKSPHLLKLFVCNRITAILESTSISQWYHIPSELNVSDAASRGLSPQNLISFKTWFDGPTWALDPPDTWPIRSFDPLPITSLPEIKTPTPLVLTNQSTNNSDISQNWFTRFSNFLKIQRVFAHIQRFLHNSRHPQSRRTGPLSVLELKMAFTLCIKLDQLSSFKNEYICLSKHQPCKTKIQSLSPFLDTAGLIRVGGRLINSDLPFEAKHPILLNNQSSLTRLVISYYHESYLHAGPRTLQSLLARKFWILNSRSLIRQVIYKCVRCSRFRSSTVTPPMGNLPSARVLPGRPFLSCGVDLAGPYLLKESLRRGARTYKGYFALFICFTIKAVHIEILTSLSADCFINALHRFVSRRGLPAHIFCDQATNFRGASRQLSEIVTFLRNSNVSEIVQDYFSKQSITFHFNVPRAPHMSGLSESNIKNVKYHLTRVIGDRSLTLEEFSTITARVEAVLNSRPLCSTSSSPDDLQTLTPGHFLIGAPLVSVAEPNFEEVPMARLSRWELVSQIHRSFWRRWEREYLHTLQNKGKWFDPQPNITEGQMIWLKEDGSPPLSYPLGRVVQLHPGQDKVVRAVTVRTRSGVYRRPVRKIAPLPIF